MRNAFWLLAPFLVALLFVGFCSGGPVHRFHKVSGSDIFALDLTGDEIWDLVIPQGSRLNLLKRNKRGHFSAPMAHELEQGLAAKLALADLNGDGRPDVVANTGQLFLGEADGFSSSVLELPKCKGWLAGDLNGDGETDLLTCDLTSRAGQTEYRVVAILNLMEALSGGKPRLSKLATLEASADEFELADLDGDSAPDLIVLLPTSQDQVQVYRNEVKSGDGFKLFQKRPFASASGLLVHDLNGDSRPDLVVSASDRSELQVMFGDGQGRVEDKGVVKTSGPPRSVSAGRLNDDTHADLAVVCYGSVGKASDEVILYGGDGTGKFEEFDRWKTRPNPALVKVLDLEGQAPDDVLILGESSELESFLQSD